MLRHALLRLAATAPCAAASETACALLARNACFDVHASGGALQTARLFSSSAPGSPDVGDKMSEMVELMMRDPGTQQLLLAKLPPHMRKPEVLRAMMANPEVKQRINSLAASTGLDKVWSTMGADRLESSLAAARAAGIDPAAQYAQLAAHPTLAPKLQNPRVLKALMDCCSNGPDALKKYEGDKEVLDAYMEAAEILQQKQSPQASESDSTSSSSPSAPPGPPGDASAAAAMQQQLGIDPQQLMGMLINRPELMAKVQDPEVLEALTTVAKSPWKIVKYLLNPKVMSALKDLKDLMQDAQAGAQKK